MELIADLHVHSRFSRATSRELDFVTLHRAALAKGIGLVGTGDFTHPAWRQEISEQLEEAEPGLFRLRPELERESTSGVPPACAGEVRFVLQVEISCIYSRDGRVRKNHNLVLVPSLDAADRLIEKLSAVGNLASDGRPILGLDARDLLEITLEVDPAAFLIPAHVWTPWFSMLGSKSGFDSLDECFRDLAPHVFVAETGLSSDPPMNWRVSSLDRLTLVSSSDAHSAGNLGREANLLDIELGYLPLREALESRAGFLGTLEFHPEHGKYHLDGHRKCSLRLEPEETRRLGGRCPSCGGIITVGVMSRVQELANRPPGQRPAGAADFEHLVPLDEVVSQALGVTAASQKVGRTVELLRSRLGPDLDVLRRCPLEEIRAAAGSLLEEAVRRVRTGELTVAAGFDGEFGTVALFAAGERERHEGQLSFFAAAESPKPAPRARRGRVASAEAEVPCVKEPTAPRQEAAPQPVTALDADQCRAVESVRGPLLIVAGPGAGKTRTVAARIAHLVARGHVKPSQVLAIAFTNQAVAELEARIAQALPAADGEAPLVTTFHGVGLRLLTEGDGTAPKVADDARRAEIAREVAGQQATRQEQRELLERISHAKQGCDPEAELASDPGALQAFRRYEELLRENGLVDVDDLVLRAWQRLRQDSPLLGRCRERFRSITVDEYQDVNDVQAALLALLASDGSGLCVIGDPDQAIYGFRGARPGHFARFAEAYPGAVEVHLGTSYRLSRQVLAVARSVMGRERDLAALRDGPPVEIVACATAAAEAEQILVRLETLIGGSSLFAVDSGRGGEAELAGVGFGDVAVLVRTRAQRQEILTALGRSGIPCRAVGEDEPHDPRAAKVAVMTLHAAKGREFAVVFVAGVEEGLLPLAAAGLVSDPEEERRLLYVAITRARLLAVISHARSRVLWGQRLPGRPSPFLSELPADAVRHVEPEPRRGDPSSRQMKLF